MHSFCAIHVQFYPIFNGATAVGRPILQIIVFTDYFGSYLRDGWCLRVAASVHDNLYSIAYMSYTVSCFRINMGKWEKLILEINFAFLLNIDCLQYYHRLERLVSAA